jgi:glycogen phosphorylase
MTQVYKDPVCGMNVQNPAAPSASYAGKTWQFCSDYCRRCFEGDPTRYSGSVADVGGAEGAEPSPQIAYFSMEVAVEPDVPTYSGGLGVLAGDTIRSMADLKVPAVAVTLLYKHGYFDQRLDEWGNQRELPVQWEPKHFARLLPNSVKVNVEGRAVTVRAWRHDVAGITGGVVPVILLDTDCDPNTGADRELTHWLYGGDQRYRLIQEMVLGIGGVRMLRSLGFHDIQRFHMNEGHAALLSIELLNESGGTWDFQTGRHHCVFTTHTPVPAGHDQFDDDLVRSVFTEPVPLEPIRMLGGEGRLNMTLLALNTSRYVNGVAKKHGEVSRAMFPGYQIDSITNGVHSVTWTGDGFRALFDRYVPGWANDPMSLRKAVNIPSAEIWAAHEEQKRRLIEAVNRVSGNSFRDDALTIAFARRATPYKRPDLLFRDPSRLAAIARAGGPIQVVYAGKAHPRDEGGKDAIRRIVRAARELGGRVSVAYLENYDVSLAKLLVGGADVWLNTPQRPLEASGTSGMKAAHNGVPSLSVLDGWWIEGHIEGVTGWSIGPSPDGSAAAMGDAADSTDADDLYRKLEERVLPAFYKGREQWVNIMRQCIALNAAFFNTHRMVQQYAVNAYV